MNMSAMAYENHLDYILDQLNLYLSFSILIFGTVGNIFNCIVLSQRTLRSNPCAFYFLNSSIINLLSILFGLPTTITSNCLCKLRIFIVFTLRTMAIWLIMLASIDRWLLSSRNSSLRKFSHLKSAKFGILFSFLVSIISCIHVLYCYKGNLDIPLKCYYEENLKCHLITDFIYALITIIIPSILMFIFSLLIISNIHHSRVRVQNLTIVSMFNLTRIKLKQIDHHLLRMLLLQVFLLLIFCILQAIHKFYITFKSPTSNQNWHDAFNQFLYKIDILLVFIANGMPFYLYTLSGGTIFRRAFFDLIEIIRRFR